MRKPAPTAAEASQRRPDAASRSPGGGGAGHVFFASNAESSYITGEVLTLLGGETGAG
jgi:hypothetical protein